MLARSATVLLFTLLTQPSWSERTGCCFNRIVRAISPKVMRPATSDDYTNELTYKDYDENTALKDIPDTFISTNGITLLVGEFYKPTTEVIGDPNSKCLCSKENRVMTVVNDYVPKVKYISEIVGRENYFFSAEDIKNRFSVKTTIWRCSNDGDRREHMETIKFLRIVNVLTTSKYAVCEHFQIHLIRRLCGVKADQVEKEMYDHGDVKAEAKITEIKYFDENTKKPVKYLGKVKLVGEETKTP